MGPLQSVYHGVSPFISVLQNGAWIPRYQILINIFINTPALLLTSSLLGMIYSITFKEFKFLLWIILILVIIPRGGNQYLVIPASLLTGLAIEKLFLTGFIVNSSLKTITTLSDIKQIKLLDILKDKRLRNVFFLLITILFLFSYPLIFIINPSSLNSEEIEALEWIKKNTTESSRFLIIGPEYFTLSPFFEWFPTLSSRENILAIQGYEWLPNKKFLVQIEDYSELMKCKGQNYFCLENWKVNRNRSFDYVVIPKSSKQGKNLVYENQFLRASMIKSSLYLSVFNNNEIQIFLRNNIP